MYWVNSKAGTKYVIKCPPELRIGDDAKECADLSH